MHSFSTAASLIPLHQAQATLQSREVRMQLSQLAWQYDAVRLQCSGAAGQLGQQLPARSAAAQERWHADRLRPE